MKNAAIAIQRWFCGQKQMQVDRLNFCEKRNATIAIQRWYRSVKLMQECRKKFLRQKNAVYKIDSFYKSHIETRAVRNQFLQKKNAAVKIQRWYRSIKISQRYRKSYFLKKNAVLKIESFYHNLVYSRKVRNEFLEQKHAAILIQRWFRRVTKLHEDHADFCRKRQATIIIQRWYRSVKLVQLTRNNYLLQKRELLKSKIEEDRADLARKNAAAVIIQRWYKNHVLLVIRRKKAALKIQKVWRGYKTRKLAFESNSKVKDVFVKVQETNSRASEQMQLGNRTSVALVKLLTYKFLNPLSNDLNSLEVTTSLSQESCKTISNEENAIKILMTVIRETNRSEPHKRILSYAVGILLNLAKFEETTEKVRSTEGIFNLILEYMKIYYKCDAIFNKLATLMFVLLSNNPQKEIVTGNVCNQKAVSWLHSKIKEEYERKKLRRRRGNRSLKFPPLWCTARNVSYEFDDRFHAIASISMYF
ncbi:abnormal spindle-like microcephaly-associated protein-like protein [Dinothrombium tinctorium]|nr:abnormal spindle-like microcephaly-associated protein-like protein [Dinothrombium tinctorium]RWS05392.1 abnormal spindle-like microcephaly-associated protein-like protein [Dinothrombium tinctorium]